MTCKYCNSPLAPLRSLTDGEFCSDEHRYAFAREHSASEEPPEELEQGQPTAFGMQSGGEFRVSNEPAPVMAAGAEPGAADVAQPAALAEPSAEAEQDAAAPEPDTPWKSSVPRRNGRPIVGSWPWIAAAWKTASFDLRALMILLPALLALACLPTLRAMRTHVPADSLTHMRAPEALQDQWKSLAQRISSRAAIAITDDFRSGLDSWESKANLTKTWSYDANGFVEPGPLALLKPTQDLRDYSFEFLGEIEHRAVGAAFRARDLDNYYAVKFVEVKANYLPTIHLVRYAVINGKEGPHVEKPLPASLRADMLNRFTVLVNGHDFTILAQGEVVDFFSDNRLTAGGIGLFCSRGEKARLRWVEVSHQYDALGRLCAYLSPFGFTAAGKD